MARSHTTTQSLLLMQSLLNPVPTASAALLRTPNQSSTSDAESRKRSSVATSASRLSPSPFTLILDTLAQSSIPLLENYIRCAKRSKAHVVWVSFETLATPVGVDTSVRAWEKANSGVDESFGLEGVRKRVTEVISGVDDEGNADARRGITDALARLNPRRTLVLIDSLHAIVAEVGAEATGYLSSFITPTSAVVAVAHAEIPFAPDSLQPSHSHTQEPRQLFYAPPPLSLLCYLATTIMTVHSIAHVLARKAARNRSVVEPILGLAGESEDREGVLVGLGSQDSRGFVIEMEHRRKSGRSVGEWYVFPPSSSASGFEGSERFADSRRQTTFSGITLLEDHPLFCIPTTMSNDRQSVEQDGVSDLHLPFNLSLTERQRADRKDVVLPYFDAQRAGGSEGPGDGGRILYDFGSEDDFDEEEDEI